MRPNRLLPALLALSLVASACDKVSPTAPTGATLTITASPLEIAANGTADVTVIANRAAGGGPVTPGTEIRLSSTLGSIDEIATTDASGVARATLRGTGRSGTAKITASSGAAAPVTVDVKVGATIQQVNLSVNPTSVPAGRNADIRVAATVRDDQGLALPGAQVLFAAEAGRFDKAGLVTADANGQATNRLRVSSADLAQVADRTLDVTASSGGAAPATVGVKIGATVERINLSLTPTSVPVTEDAVISVTAIVRDNQGLPLRGAGVIFSSEVGQFDKTGIVTTNSGGQALNQLRVTATELALMTDSSLQVSAEAAGGGGNATASANVLIRRPPVDAFTFTVNQSTRTATFTDQSTGGPTEWEWDVDGDGDIDATSPSFQYQYPAAGSFRVRLVVRNVFGEDDAVQQLVINQ